ncbi:Metallo-hydrolase/oxidoreductase [Vararia minispora EC-137]|uniref:Metallo-hydrolase/oxidoreductase n=1 Tax=Vararia minispora EC-137 TaxID=1314806 RepID=A0ACB8QBE0_9AGAM|nr:Metallo-hydrolase/oxidoreductase [Vararia minispora EC-137]
MSNNSLPPPQSDQPFFEISALEAGFMTFRTDIFLEPQPPSLSPSWEGPSLCFLLRHSATGEYILFDSGFRKSMDQYPPVAQALIQKFFAPVRVSHDAADRVAEGGLSPSNVSKVIISHAHFDHIGNSSRFPAATYIVGKGTHDLAASGYPTNPDSPYGQDTLPTGRTRVLDPSDASLSWTQIGPFEHALDLLGDGSAYIIDSPGHLPGHINLLVRTSTDGAWAHFAADSVHDWSLFHGTSVFAAHPDVGCVHLDKESAVRQVAKLRELAKVPRVRILLAHDVPLWKKARENDWDGFWPKKIPSL